MCVIAPKGKHVAQLFYSLNQAAFHFPLIRMYSSLNSGVIRRIKQIHCES